MKRICSIYKGFDSLSTRRPENEMDVTLKVTTESRVTTFKLLGVFISSDLSWDYHVTYLLRKVAKRMYCMNYIFISRRFTCIWHCVCLYLYNSFCSWICMSCLVSWFDEKNLSKDIECVQKRCLKCCFQPFHILSHYVKVPLNVETIVVVWSHKVCLDKLKTQNTPYIICYLLLRCFTVRWFCGLHIHIKFHWPKLHVM